MAEVLTQAFPAEFPTLTLAMTLVCLGWDGTQAGVFTVGGLPLSGGDLGGTLAAPRLTKINGKTLVAATNPSEGDHIVFTGGQWVSTSSVITNTQIAAALSYTPADAITVNGLISGATLIKGMTLNKSMFPSSTAGQPSGTVCIVNGALVVA